METLDDLAKEFGFSSSPESSKKKKKSKDSGQASYIRQALPQEEFPLITNSHRKYLSTLCYNYTKLMFHKEPDALTLVLNEAIMELRRRLPGWAPEKNVPFDYYFKSSAKFAVQRAASNLKRKEPKLDTSRVVKEVTIDERITTFFDQVVGKADFQVTSSFLDEEVMSKLKLTTVEKKVLVWYYIDGYTTKAIAKAIKWKVPNAVQRVKNAALEKIRLYIANLEL